MLFCLFLFSSLLLFCTISSSYYASSSVISFACVNFSCRSQSVTAALGNALRDTLRYEVLSDVGEELKEDVHIKDIVLRDCGPALRGADGASHIGALLLACRETVRSITVDCCDLGETGAKTLVPYFVSYFM